MTALRVFVFPRAERAIVVYVPDDVDTLVLPPLDVPFKLVAVAEALGDRARVSDEEPGRWGPTIRKARLDVHAALGQQACEREAKEAQMLLGSNEAPEVRVLYVVHAEIINRNRTRIISARVAKKSEALQYTLGDAT